jgi:hypothetical protein
MPCRGGVIFALSMWVFLCLSFTSAYAQKTINVPADQATIQGAINLANNGDTVLVAPGTYYENINFMGKAITVTSSSGPGTTVIDASGNGSVVTFNNGEGSGSVLNGFTIQHGSASNFEGGGIDIVGTSPTITNNVIQNNMACVEGGAIAASFASPRIQGNTIQNNAQVTSCVGSGGGGIALRGAGQAQIIGNLITNNVQPTGDGAGIYLNAAGTPLIRANVIAGNTALGANVAWRCGLYG